MNKCFKVRKLSIRIIWLYGWINHRQYMPLSSSPFVIHTHTDRTLPFISIHSQSLWASLVWLAVCVRVCIFFLIACNGILKSFTHLHSAEFKWNEWWQQQRCNCTSHSIPLISFQLHHNNWKINNNGDTKHAQWHAQL